MYIQLGLNPKVAKLIIREQGLNSPDRLRILTDKNNDGICNVVRKPDSKNIDQTPDRKQQISVIAQENPKLLGFLFYHRLRCTFDWEIMEVNKETVYFLAGKKKLKDEYNTQTCCQRLINLTWQE